MFSLRFAGSKFLINLRRKFRVRKIFSYTSSFSCKRFCEIYSLLILCFKLLFRKCVTYVAGRSIFNPIQDGHFRGCSRMGGGGKGLPSLKSVTHILQWWNLEVIPYLKKILKIYESRDTPLTSANISIFSPEISKFCYIKKSRYRMHFSP